MKILVIGGTYFLGRVFTIMASREHELTLIHRGRYSMDRYPVREYHFDRKNPQGWQQLPKEDYDVVVDFCAYDPKDIQIMIENYLGNIKKYIFISTCDVYQRQTKQIKDELHPLEVHHYSGEVGDYIANKILLEKELMTLSKQHSFEYTILRPGMIYGPYNYAPRETTWIERIVNHLPLVKLTDNTGEFQMVYVKDVVNAILACLNHPTNGKIYNIVGKEILNYERLLVYFEKISDEKISYVVMNSREALAKQLPLPFPIYDHETELYNGQKICDELNLTYTSLEDGLKITYEAFVPVFKHD